MVRARGVTRAGMVSSHAAFEQLADDDDAAWSRPAARIGSCHVALAETKQTIPGLRTVAWGDAEDCPPRRRGRRPADRRLSRGLTGPQQCGPVAATMLPPIVFWTPAGRRLRATPAARPERRAHRRRRLRCATLLTHFVLGPLADQRYSGVEHGLVAIDVAMLAIFVAVALRSRPLLAVVGGRSSADDQHGARDEGDRRAADAARLCRGARFWSYPILLIILIALLAHRAATRSSSAARTASRRLDGCAGAA